MMDAAFTNTLELFPGDIKSSIMEEIKQKEEDLKALKNRLNKLTEMTGQIPQKGADTEEGQIPEQRFVTEKEKGHSLTNEEIGRYSRQLILPELGVTGQEKLLCSKVLIVGAGGLGCPSAIYLAAAGVGTIGIVDYDDVEISNLHRQILHTESRVGLSKAQSVAVSCSKLNSSLKFIPHNVSLDSKNALDIIRGYDVVLDATDNVATRYLLNDACVLAGKPLVSGSALRFEGQLTVYNYKEGPCYRCLFPNPPPPETVTNCSDGGVLGVVPGIIGSYQALEAIKIITGIGDCLSQRMLLLDAADCTTRMIKVRGRQKQCPVCGDNPIITQLIDYEQFCGARATDKDQEKKVLPASIRMSVKEYMHSVENQQKHVLVDVRLPVEVDICRLPFAFLNIPLDTIKKDPAAQVQQIKSCAADSYGAEEPYSVVVVCRRGNDSQVAVQLLQEAASDLIVRDVRGGLHAWARDIDPNFPVY